MRERREGGGEEGGRGRREGGEERRREGGREGKEGERGGGGREGEKGRRRGQGGGEVHAVEEGVRRARKAGRQAEKRREGGGREKEGGGGEERGNEERRERKKKANSVRRKNNIQCTPIHTSFTFSANKTRYNTQILTHNTLITCLTDSAQLVVLILEWRKIVGAF